MSVRVERTPAVVVTDEETGWTMRGGRDFADGAGTNLMEHTNGARCTIWMSRIESDGRPGRVVRILGMVYLNAGEGEVQALRKVPGVGDFVSEDELYRIAQRLTVSWHEATYADVAPMRVLLPEAKQHYGGRE